MIERLESGRYRVRVYSRGRYVASRTFQRKKDAQSFDQAQKLALAAGTWVSPRAGQVTVAEYSKTFLASKATLTPSSRASIESALNTNVLPEFGRQPLSNIAPSAIEIWSKNLVKDKSVATARKSLGVFRQLFALAVRDGVIPRNPAIGIRLPVTRGNEPRPLKASELQKLAESAKSERDRLMILVAGYGGLRFGELAGLQVQDLQGHRIRLVRSVAHVSGGPIIGDLKSHQARTVVLPRTLMADLRQYASGMLANDWLFPSAAGTPLRRQSWSKNVLRPSAQRAGIGSLTSHNLRDTAASLAVDAGASVVVVARMLGHQDASVTLRHYASLFPTDLDDLAQRMEAVMNET